MRLQTVPETYAFTVSPSQAYKMLGNGWTVDVIAHIMGHFEGLTAEPVEVLSMYDGMSCGHIALGKLGAEIASYHATEIDKFAIQTTQANFPDVVQLGDAFQVREDGWTYAGLTGGTNSTAMIIGMYLHKIPIDLILFADTGGEQPHTYEFIETFNGWLEKHGLPQITSVQYHDKDGNRLTLEQECINSGTLPSIAYGFKRCSLKHKIGTQEKFCNNYQPCKEVWASGQRVQKYIGYDAGETRRIQHAAPIDEADKKYEKHYPLYEWGWTREECVRVIERAGLPKPGKSSCFFCTSMKKKEIQALWENYPDLFQRAIALEHGSAARNVNVKGLGRDWSWESYYNEFMENKAFEDAQITFDELFPDSSGGCLCGAPCGCYDG